MLQSTVKATCSFWYDFIGIRQREFGTSDRKEIDKSALFQNRPDGARLRQIGRHTQTFLVPIGSYPGLPTEQHYSIFVVSCRRSHRQNLTEASLRPTIVYEPDRLIRFSRMYVALSGYSVWPLFHGLRSNVQVGHTGFFRIRDVALLIFSWYWLLYKLRSGLPTCCNRISRKELF